MVVSHAELVEGVFQEAFDPDDMAQRARLDSLVFRLRTTLLRLDMGIDGITMRAGGYQLSGRVHIRAQKK